MKRVFIFEDGSRKTYEATDEVLVAADRLVRPTLTVHTWRVKSISIDKGEYVRISGEFKKVIDIKPTT